MSNLTVGKRVYMDSTIIHYDSNGLLHNDNGPAVEYESGYKAWYRHGILHRDSGPAIYSEPVKGIELYFLHGIEFNKRKYDELIYIRKIEKILDRL